MFIACAFTHRQDEIDLEDKEDHFQPQLGNVAFASAHDGWAFRIGQLAKQYADKLGCKASGLEQALWGDYAFQAKTKRIIRIKPDQTHKHKPLFVQVPGLISRTALVLILYSTPFRPRQSTSYASRLTRPISTSLSLFRCGI